MALAITVRYGDSGWRWFFIAQCGRELWSDGVEYETDKAANSEAAKVRRWFHENQRQVDDY